MLFFVRKNKAALPIVLQQAALLPMQALLTLVAV